MADKYTLVDTCEDEYTRIMTRHRFNTCDGCVAKHDKPLCDELGMKCAKPKFHMWHVWKLTADLPLTAD